MNNIEVTTIDLVEGGNVFKQGHHLTLGYIPRDEKGAVVDLSNKTLNVAIWGRIGVVFEGLATFSTDTIRFTLKELIPAGDYQVEFTATSTTDSSYRKKFPTNITSGRITVKKSSDDLEATGVSVITVTQFRKEFDIAIAAVTKDAEVALARKDKATLGQRLDADKQELSQRLAEEQNKLDNKVGSGVLATMGDLAQDIKTAMTGGSVAVVGPGAVTNVNLANDVKTRLESFKYTSTIVETPINLGDLTAYNTNLSGANNRIWIQYNSPITKKGFINLKIKASKTVSTYIVLLEETGVNFFKVKAKQMVSLVAGENNIVSDLQTAVGLNQYIAVLDSVGAMVYNPSLVGSKIHKFDSFDLNNTVDFSSTLVSSGWGLGIGVSVVDIKIITDGLSDILLSTMASDGDAWEVTT